MQKRILIFFIIIIILFFSFVNPAFALENVYPRIPVMGETLEKCFEASPEARLGCFGKYIYYLCLLVSGLICVFNIFFGGFLHLVSAGSVDRIKEGRKRIFIGFVGVLILFSSFLILNFLNPQLLIFGIKRPEPGEPFLPPEIEPSEEEFPVYIEIPIGRLIERVKIASEVSGYWVYHVWYEGVEDKIENHSSLKELTECLVRLTDRCDCQKIMTKDCPPGACVGDPCDIQIEKTICQDLDVSLETTNLRQAINEIKEKITEQDEKFEKTQQKLELAKEALIFAKYRLEVAEDLIRDSIYSAINFDTFIGYEDVEKRRLWTYEDVPIAEATDPSGMPIPPQECSGDKPYEIIPSCTLCGGVLHCYGNEFRLCDTEQKIKELCDPPDAYPRDCQQSRWFAPDDFPSGSVLYNGIAFEVPLGGVSVTDTNTYPSWHCNANISEAIDDPATFYIPEQGNEDIIALVEGLLAKLPPVGPPPAPGWVPGMEQFYNLPSPPPEAGDVNELAEFSSENSGVRASLILALLAHESGYKQFPGTGNYPYDLCKHPNCSGIADINCRSFERLWKDLAGSINGIYAGYTIYNIPVSAAGTYCAAGECLEHCGGAMGPAQAMSFTWLNYKNRIQLITGKSSASPWDYKDAFLFAGLFLADKGADSQKCSDEAQAVWRYVGGHRNHSYMIVEMANQIADTIGENHCHP